MAALQRIAESGCWHPWRKGAKAGPEGHSRLIYGLLLLYPPGILEIRNL